MKRIPLTQGKFALVDDEDFEWFSRWRWHTQKSRRTFYATRNQLTQKGKQKTIYMHRVILRLPKDVQADHINGRGLDNRKQNLRIATVAQNHFNQQSPRLGCVSKFKGVVWDKRSQKWMARIRFNYKRYYLGLFDKEVRAAKAYNKAARELFGEFAALNIFEGR